MYSFSSRRPFLHPLNPLYQNVPTSATILSFADYLTLKPPPHLSQPLTSRILSVRDIKGLWGEHPKDVQSACH